MTASTVNGRDQITAATLGSGLHTTASYLGETQTRMLTANLGSTVGIVNATGVKTAAYSYDPYGRTRTATGTAAPTNAFRYAGGLFD